VNSREAAYFQYQDYASFWLRVPIDLIDGIAVRIVGTDGRIASWTALSIRLCFALLGPANWLLDLIWLSGDKHRQSLRDKFAHTYVVKTQAQPAGDGKVVSRTYEICGYNFLFQEIEIREQP
jgi:hypothetical protein